jgi:hypothetical protein
MLAAKMERELTPGPKLNHPKKLSLVLEGIDVTVVGVIYLTF